MTFVMDVVLHLSYLYPVVYFSVVLANCIKWKFSRITSCSFFKFTLVNTQTFIILFKCWANANFNLAFKELNVV